MATLTERRYKDYCLRRNSRSEAPPKAANTIGPGSGTARSWRGSCFREQRKAPPICPRGDRLKNGGGQSSAPAPFFFFRSRPQSKRRPDRTANNLPASFQWRRPLLKV